MFSKLNSIDKELALLRGKNRAFHSAALGSILDGPPKIIISDVKVYQLSSLGQFIED